MASRMNRYHSNTRSSRSSRNENLYDSIYNEEIEYSNVEGIARIEKTNEIDIERIREMLKLEEEKKKKKSFQPLFKTSSTDMSELNLSRLDDKNYDIRDILNKAHEEKVEEVRDEPKKELLNTQYNILKKIKLDDPIDGNLQNLIDAVNYNSKNNVEDTMGLLDDLEDDSKTISDEAIKKIIAEAKEEIKEKVSEPEKTTTIDTSFFTSSLNFNDDDFEELKEISDSYKKKKKRLRIFLFLIFMSLITVGILYYLEIIKF